jgi:beta-lactamase class A
MRRASWQAKMVRVTPSSSSPDSATFNPPHLSGKVSERTALEAMIIHSDNTGTDMILKHVGADRVLDFLADARLKRTHIPNSTRQFLGYLAALPDWRTTTRRRVYVRALGVLRIPIELASRPRFRPRNCP